MYVISKCRRRRKRMVKLGLRWWEKADFPLTQILFIYSWKERGKETWTRKPVGHFLIWSPGPSCQPHSLLFCLQGGRAPRSERWWLRFFRMKWSRWAVPVPHPARLSLLLTHRDRCLKESFLGFSSNVRVFTSWGCKTELPSLLFSLLSIS